LYINKKRKTVPLLKKGDKVYLYIKHLYTKQLSKRLNNIKVRLFLILKQNRPVIYTLKLLLDVKIYPRFYINLLELASLETLLQQTFRYKIEEEKEFKVKKILNYRQHCI
jgi:hypothetical protein